MKTNKHGLWICFIFIEACIVFFALEVRQYNGLPLESIPLFHGIVKEKSFDLYSIETDEETTNQFYEHRHINILNPELICVISSDIKFQIGDTVFIRYNFCEGSTGTRGASFPSSYVDLKEVYINGNIVLPYKQSNLWIYILLVAFILWPINIWIPIPIYRFRYKRCKIVPYEYFLKFKKENLKRGIMDKIPGTDIVENLIFVDNCYMVFDYNDHYLFVF